MGPAAARYYQTAVQLQLGEVRRPGLERSRCRGFAEMRSLWDDAPAVALMTVRFDGGQTPIRTIVTPELTRAQSQPAKQL